MGVLTVDNITLSDRDFRRISAAIYKHCGIHLHEGKRELVRARLAKQVRIGGFANIQQYLTHVFQDKSGRAFSIMVDSLSTNLTSFFRESQHFEFLQQHLAVLMARRTHPRQRRLRAWSAGCSSGEEPYSIAIVLLEAVQGQGTWDVKVLGTDISTRMLEIARQGQYSAARVAPVPAPLKHRYLLSRKEGRQRVYEVGDALRRTVLLRYLNLMDSWPVKGPIDFIFCRNVMIYFDKPTQERLVQRYYEILNHKGILFTGHSESLTGVNHGFTYVEPTIYMKP